MTGPLTPYASGLAGELARLGFTEGSANGQLGLAAHLSRWLAAAGVGTEALTALAATMQAFFTERLIAQRRASPHTITASPIDRTRGGSLRLK
jgi:hypothetical protein